MSVQEPKRSWVRSYSQCVEKIARLCTESKTYEPAGAIHLVAELFTAELTDVIQDVSRARAVQRMVKELDPF